MQAHSMLVAYPVLYEKEGEYVARFKCTALILPNYTQRITPMELPAGIASNHSVKSDQVKQLLEQPIGKQAKRLSKQAARASQKAGENGTTAELQEPMKDV